MPSVKLLTTLSLFSAFHGLMAAQAITLKNNPFQYSAMYTDSESRLQYLNARYYDPATQHFIQWDTYSEDDKSSLFDNRYNYGGGDPINNSDPSGHCIFPPGTGPFKDIVQAFDPYVSGDPAASLVNAALMMPISSDKEEIGNLYKLLEKKSEAASKLDVGKFFNKRRNDNLIPPKEIQNILLSNEDLFMLFRSPKNKIQSEETTLDSTQINELRKDIQKALFVTDLRAPPRLSYNSIRIIAPNNNYHSLSRIDFSYARSNGWNVIGNYRMVFHSRSYPTPASDMYTIIQISKQRIEITKKTLSGRSYMNFSGQLTRI